jgi:hypothetical protein
MNCKTHRRGGGRLACEVVRRSGHKVAPGVPHAPPYDHVLARCQFISPPSPVPCRRPVLPKMARNSCVGGVLPGSGR